MGKTKVVLLLLVIQFFMTFVECQILEGMAITLEAMDALLEKNIESLSKIFDHFTQMFKNILPAITIETIIDKYISLVMYAMKSYNHLIYTPLKMQQLLNLFKNEHGWNNVFLIAEHGTISS